MKKVGIYEHLMMALFDTKQIGPFNVLLRGFFQHQENGSNQTFELTDTFSSLIISDEDIQKDVKFEEIDQLLRNCFNPVKVEISYSWWNNTKFCSKEIQSFEFSNRTL